MYFQLAEIIKRTIIYRLNAKIILSHRRLIDNVTVLNIQKDIVRVNCTENK